MRIISLRVSVRELERLDELRFRQFVGRAFDHDDVVFGADVNEIEIALHRARSWVGLATNSPLTRPTRTAPIGPGERNIGNGKRGRRAVDRENIGIIFAIGAEQDGDDLGVVKITCREKRPQRPIGHARSERFFFGRASFAFEIAAGKFSRRLPLFRGNRR